MTRFPTVALAAMAAVLMAAAPVAALINPRFTPVDLVTDAQVILKVSLGKAPLDGGRLPEKVFPLTVTDVTVLQGEADAPERPELLIDATIARVYDDLAAALTGPEADRAMIFYGDLSAAKETEDTGEAQPVAMLHVGTYWFALVPGRGNALVTAPDELRLKEVWAGSNLMLERVIRYAIDDIRADVPVASGVMWDGEVVLEAPGGKVHGLQAVELTGTNAPGLFVLSDGGDRFHAAGGPAAFDDVTGKVNLATKSVAAAWGDFDGDGRLDLVSSDGKAAVFCRMTESGTLAAPTPGPQIAGCVALTVAGRDGTSRLVAATQDGPVLAERGQDGTWAVTPLGKAKGLGKAGPCAVADVTGDGVVDIVQLYGADVLLARGAADGTFAEAKPAWSNPAGTEDRVLVTDPAALLAEDYDADGQIDLLAVGTGQGDVQLLRNTGGAFLASVTEAGEVTYNTGQIRTNGALAWDANNDGREEFLITTCGLNPLPFFNRGFSTFGYARDLELAGNESLPGVAAVNKGQQAGVAADFDGDGMQEVALAAADGSIVVLHVKQKTGEPLALRVALPTGAAREVSVMAVDGRRRLGSKTVAPGRPARFGKRTKGPMTLTWTGPDGRERSRQVIVLKPTRWELPAE